MGGPPRKREDEGKRSESEIEGRQVLLSFNKGKRASKGGQYLVGLGHEGGARKERVRGEGEEGRRTESKVRGPREKMNTYQA